MDVANAGRSFAPNACHSVSPMCDKALPRCRVVLILLILVLFHPVQAGSQQRPQDTDSTGLTASQRMQYDLRSVRVADLIVAFDELEYRESDSEWHETLPVDTLFLKHLVLLQLQQALQKQEQTRTIELPPLPGEVKPHLGEFLDIRAVIAADKSEANAIQTGLMNEAVIEQAGSGHRARIHQDGRNNRAFIRQAGN